MANVWTFFIFIFWTWARLAFISSHAVPISMPPSLRKTRRHDALRAPTSRKAITGKTTGDHEESSQSQPDVASNTGYHQWRYWGTNLIERDTTNTVKIDKDARVHGDHNWFMFGQQFIQSLGSQMWSVPTHPTIMFCLQVLSAWVSFKNLRMRRVLVLFQISLHAAPFVQHFHLQTSRIISLSSMTHTQLPPVQPVQPATR